MPEPEYANQLAKTDRKKYMQSMPEIKKEESTQPGTPNSWRKSWRAAASYVAIACVGFVTVEGINRIRPTEYLATPEKSTIWWATKHWCEQQQKPDVVLLGSSLMIAAQNDCDATFFDRNFDAVKHYQSLYLESKLSRTNHPFTTASFVIGGQMASDAYAIITTLFAKDSNAKKDSTPAIVVWGIAPRDFVDATFGRPEDTETVRLMDRIANLDDVLHTHKIPFWNKVENVFANACSLYGKRSELRALQHESVQSWLNSVTEKSSGPTEVKSPPWLLHQMSLAFPEDNRVGQWVVRPCKKKGEESRDNNAEYQSRYNPFKPAQFDQQMQFYDKALEAAQKQGSRVLIVNMPLTVENMRLLPAGVYEQYLKNVSEHAAAHGAKFLDLNRNNTFTAKDFWDPVHLDGYGATKFMDVLSKQLAI